MRSRLSGAPAFAACALACLGVPADAFLRSGTQGSAGGVRVLPCGSARPRSDRLGFGAAVAGELCEIREVARSKCVSGFDAWAGLPRASAGSAGAVAARSLV